MLPALGMDLVWRFDHLILKRPLSAWRGRDVSLEYVDQMGSL